MNGGCIDAIKIPTSDLTGAMYNIRMGMLNFGLATTFRRSHSSIRSGVIEWDDSAISVISIFEGNFSVEEKKIVYFEKCALMDFYSKTKKRF